MFLWKQCAMLLNTLQPTTWLYISDEHPIDRVRHSIAGQGVPIENGIILPSEQFFFRQAIIRIPIIIDALKKEIAQLVKKSIDLQLIMIEMTWAVRTPSGAIYLREYEAAIHQLSQDTNISICCLYNQAVVLDDQLMTALQTHTHLLTQEGIKENPYFLPPTIFAKRNQRQQFNYWLQKVKPSTEPLEEMEATQETDTAVATPVQPIYNIDTPEILIIPNSIGGRWKIRCLGQLKIYRENGTLIDWQTKGGATRKLKTIFAFLLYKGDKGASVEELVDVLWPNTTDIQQGANRLYHAIRYVRKILSPNLKKNESSSFVLNRDNRYFLAVPADTWIDLPMFQELCFKGNAQLRKQDLENALISYQAAERLYKGDLLADIPAKYIDNLEQDWCWSRRYWYKEMNHKLLYEMASIYRKLDNIVEALNYCDKALALEPCSEMAHQEKMKTLHAAKRTDALKRQYRLYCKVLKQFDMGEPTKATQQLLKKLSE